MSKRPKNVDAVLLQQQKQLDVWLAKESHRTDSENDFSKPSELKCPLRRSTRKKHSSDLQYNEHPSYLDISTLSPSVSPSKSNFKSPLKQGLVSNKAYDTSLNVLREEIGDLYHNISGLGSFEMIHDFNDMIVSPKSLKNVLHQYPTMVDECLRLELRTNDDELLPGQQPDPLDGMWHDGEEIDQGNENGGIGADEEDQNLSEQELKKLRFLIVDLKHEVPPQHEVEHRAGTHCLTRQEHEQFKCYVQMRSGAFSSAEDEQLRANWELFCVVHQWDKQKVQPFLQMRKNNQYFIRNLEERKNFVKFLARGLPRRTLFSVYSRFKILFNSAVKKGAFTSNDDKTILSRMKSSSLSNSDQDIVAEVAKVLKRTRRSVLERFQKLNKKPNLQSSKNSINCIETQSTHEAINNETTNEIVNSSVKWTVPLVENFMQSLLKLTASDSPKQLECKMIDDDIWRKMEKNMNIDHTSLRKFWYLQLYMQIFSPAPIHINQIKIKLLDHLHELDVKAVGDIDWKTLVQYFDGVTPYFLSLLVEQLTLDAQTVIKSHEEIDVFDYLYGDYQEKFLRKSKCSVIPKFYFSEVKSDQWNLELVQNFIESLMKLTLCNDVNELKNHIIPDCVWKELEKKLEIESISLKIFWEQRLHLQLFCPSTIYLNDLKIKLIEYFYVKGVTNYRDIRWNSVISCFDGYTIKFLRRILARLNRDAKARTGSSDLGENLEYLYTKFIKHLRELFDDQKLPRLRYTEGRIQYVEKDLEEIIWNVNKMPSGSIESDGDEIPSDCE
ncbi:hypothetical protein QAD02_004037 [Eretmocerus hayati]|uniref:Uncharacterized protein n=1 Tax=Eretmocerus hayati TaxID=131215 RepID=A0ACC2NRC1_9HYME|nr:hypothetical protein QAD02_004037 [Eretmocerus hayati]